MKRLGFILITLLVSVIAYGQPGGKQPVPNFVGNDTTVAGYNKYGRGNAIGKFTGGVQGVRSAMLHGPHDFTPDSGATFSVDTTGGAHDTTWHPHAITGGSTSLCSYCHGAHIPKTGIAVPLWARASVAGKTFGKYTNPVSIDATIYDPGTTAAGFKDNYSSFCMSCHDGSAGIFAPTAYSNGFGKSTDTLAHVGDKANMYNGEFDLQHVHPVNFDYNAVQALVPEELYPAVDPVSAVWKGYAGTNGLFGASGSNYTSVRLFNGTMQCSSCHNPHMSSGIGTTLSSAYGRRCIACHKK
jgi:predicted CXXCH cytochrome family protein